MEISPLAKWPNLHTYIESTYGPLEAGPANWDRSILSHCTDSESLPGVGFEPEPACVPGQETRILTN